MWHPFPCLLFAIHNEEQDARSLRSLDQPAIKGYVAYPSEVETQCSDIFLENGFQVISNDQPFPCLRNDKFEAIELLHVRSGPKSLKVLSKKYNQEFVSSLLSINTDVSTMYYFHADCFLPVVDEGNLKGMEHFLKYAAGIKYKHPKGGTLLHLAVKRRNEMLVKCLIAHNADVSARRSDDSTPLHVAAKRGQLQIVRSLIESGARVDVKMSNGTTPLHLATLKGYPQVVEYLLEKGSIVNSPTTASFGKTPSGSTPLHCSIKKGKVYSDIAELLLKNGAEVDAFSSDVGTCLLHAVSEGCEEIVSSILKYHPDANNEFNRKALRMAIASGAVFKEAVERMLHLGFKIVPEDANDCDLLLHAVRFNIIEIAQKLLQYGASVTARSKESPFETLLHVAAGCTGEDMVKLLLSFGADVNAKCGDGSNPVRHAVAHNNLGIVKLLLQNGAKVLDDDGIAYAATVTNNPEMLAVILQHGGNPNFKTYEIDHTETPLLVAVSKRSLEMVKVLLKFGAGKEKIWSLSVFSDLEGVLSLLKVAVDQRNMLLFQTFLDCGLINTYLNCQFSIRKLFDILNFNSYPIFDSDLQFLQACRQMLALHLLKMEAANVPVCTRLLTGRVKKMWLQEAISTCEAEVANLKNEHVGVTNVTFYDVLTHSVNRIASFLRNERIAQTFLSGDYEERFPIYAGVINWQFQKGWHRKNLLEQTFDMCRLPSNKLSVLPSVVSEKIFKYLSDREIIIFNNSF